MSIGIEMSSAFFSLKIFISWGKVEAAVNALAPIPMMVIKFIVNWDKKSIDVLSMLLFNKIRFLI